MLLPLEPYLAYANFPPIGGRAVDFHRPHWLAASTAGALLVARDDGGRPLAALRLSRRAFESEHFGMAMAAIDAPIAVPGDELRLPALRALYRAACDVLRADGYAHVSAVSSTQDRAACWALQEAGCFHVGTKISWMAPLTGERRPYTLPAGLHIELHDRTTIPALARSSWQRLYEWSGRAFDRGPFVFDAGVPYERAAAVYQVWTEKAFTGEWAEVLLVVRAGDEIVAFNAMQRLPELSASAGAVILGRGIGASLPDHQGLFTALQLECAAVRPLGSSYLENETQSATVPSINVFGKLGHRCLRSIASFHRRLDADARSPAG